MKGSTIIFGCFLWLLLFKACAEPKTAYQRNGYPDSILVFSKTNGFRHSSIPDGIKAIKKIGASEGFGVHATEDSTEFAPENLKGYKAIVFLNTTGTILGPAEKKAFENFIRQGGGFLGVHAASDTEYDWPFYEKMVGAQFLSHPKQQDADLLVLTKNHPSTSFLPDTWRRWDEWYNFKNLNPAVTVLLKIDENSYKGGANGDHHPMSWYHLFEGGRVFYTALGHTEASYTEPLFVQHLTGGFRYVLGR